MLQVSAARARRRRFFHIRAASWRTKVGDIAWCMILVSILRRPDRFASGTVELEGVHAEHTRPRKDVLIRSEGQPDGSSRSRTTALVARKCHGVVRGPLRMAGNLARRRGRTSRSEQHSTLRHGDWQQARATAAGYAWLEGNKSLAEAGSTVFDVASFHSPIFIVGGTIGFCRAQCSIAT